MKMSAEPPRSLLKLNQTLKANNGYIVVLLKQVHILQEIQTLLVLWEMGLIPCYISVAIMKMKFKIGLQKVVQNSEKSVT